MERYRQGEREQLKARQQLDERLNFARRVGNHRVNSARLHQAIERTARRYLSQRGVSDKRLERLIPKAPPLSWRGMPTTGNVKTFALLIEFPDEPHGNAQSTIHEALYGAPGLGAPYESLTQYYRRASLGALELGGGATLGWYMASKNRADVEQGSQGRDDLIKEAILHFKAAGHDFAQYDNDGDGVVDYFLVFWTGPDNGWGNFWWGYQTGFSDPSFVVDGLRLDTYSWQWEALPARSEFDPRVSIHETGHALGLPDLYDYNDAFGPRGGVGGFDMMDGNQFDHNCFSKWMLDWLTPTVVSEGTHTLSLAPTGTNPECVLLWPGVRSGDLFSEMFLVQNRQRVGNDLQLPNEGLIIWHIDATTDGGHTWFLYDNSYTDHKLVRLMEADGEEEIERGLSGADAEDFYAIGTMFTPTTRPSSAKYDGTPSFASVFPRASAGDEVIATFSIEENAVIYEQPNFSGASQVLTEGRYDLSQLSLGNDRVSSVRVPFGWRVTLYEHAGFSGPSKVLTADAAGLPDFDNRTSSIRVESRPRPELYEHGDYRGRSQLLQAGHHELSRLTIGNDVVSSVRVPPVWTVVLYEHDRFGGARRILTTDAPTLADFNDRTSSIFVTDQPLPVVYEEPYFGGRSQLLAEGQYDVGALTLGNDTVSSLRIPPGWVVTLYEHANFQGASRVLTTEVGSLADFDNRTSSIRVEFPRPTLFEHANYAGRTQMLDTGRYDLADLSIGSDVVSSITVPPGWTVTLFEHAGFGGARRVVTADTPNLGDFSDRASSLIAEFTELPTVYEHYTFMGRRQVLRDGRYDVSQLSVGNDTVSSVKVPVGWKVTLFEDSNFSGESRDITYDTPMLADFNDRTSSIIVSRP